MILDDRPGALSHATAAIADVGGNILGMDVVDGDGTTIVDDFIVQLDAPEPECLAQRLGSLPGVVVECVRVARQTDLHRELELISTFAANPKPSLDLLARLVPAIVRCDWAVVVSSAGSAVGTTHASGHGPRIRWSSLPWLPLTTARTLDAGEDWVPSAWQSEALSLAAAPVDSETNVLACRGAGPAFRPREVNRLSQLGQLAGRLLQTVSSADNVADDLDPAPL